MFYLGLRPWISTYFNQSTFYLILVSCLNITQLTFFCPSFSVRSAYHCSWPNANMLQCYEIAIFLNLAPFDLIKNYFLETTLLLRAIIFMTIYYFIWVITKYKTILGNNQYECNKNDGSKIWLHFKALWWVRESLNHDRSWNYLVFKKNQFLPELVSRTIVFFLIGQSNDAWLLFHFRSKP